MRATGPSLVAEWSRNHLEHPVASIEDVERVYGRLCDLVPRDAVWQISEGE